ncbi:MAG: DUF423 domain-containing protein [Calditrichaeota bacterium]|nr:DUF423 domain-containing protein [Calditrichota bacterium]
MAKTFIILGSINMFLTVALGAFGAHGLKGRLSADLMAVYQTAVQYHGMHALGLLLIGIIAHWLGQSALINWAGWLLLTGIVLFSGSLYTMSFTGIRMLGAITPFGGVAFLAGWLLLALAAWKVA